MPSLSIFLSFPPHPLPPINKPYLTRNSFVKTCLLTGNFKPKLFRTQESTHHGHSYLSTLTGQAHNKSPPMTQIYIFRVPINGVHNLQEWSLNEHC